MTRDFQQAKNVVKYLQARYGKIKKHTISDDIKLTKDISSQHSLQELYIMKRRIQAQLTYNGDNDYANKHLNPTMLSYIAALSTFAIAMVTISFNWLQKLAEKAIDLKAEELSDKDVIGVLNIVNPSSMFVSVGKFIVLLFSILLISDLILFNIRNSKTLRIAQYLIIIDEAIQTIENNKSD